MGSARILAFASSLRRESYNRRLLGVVVAGVRKAGAECTEIDLADYPLPIYDGDLEAAQGLPRPAAALRELFRAHQGLLIASPEYNSSISPLLKNTIDWVSRSERAQPDLSGFAGKLVALCAASPGPLGGLRGLAHLRSLLANLGCTVLADQVTIRQAGQAFGEDGRLLGDRNQARAEALGARLATWVASLPPT